MKLIRIYNFGASPALPEIIASVFYSQNRIKDSSWAIFIKLVHDLTFENGPNQQSYSTTWGRADIIFYKSQQDVEASFTR